MRPTLRRVAIVAAFWILPNLWAEPGKRTDPGHRILQQYLENARDQRLNLRNVSMTVDIEADLPSLKKRGKLHALRQVSRLGRITYKVLGFDGDNMVKKDVIARYIEAEVKNSDSPRRDAMAVNAENYRFKYRGMYGDGDWKLHLFELKPRKKRLGLYNGWLWIHADTGLPVRESGRFVKNPSVFLKRVEFLKDYRLRDGIAVPSKIESEIVTRVVGTARLTIEFVDYSFHDDPRRMTAQNRPAAQ